MGSSTSAATEDPERRRKEAASRSKGSHWATLDDGEAAYSDDVERSPRGPWPPGEAPPTGLLTGMLGEMAFCYGACWRHYRSARR
jgi:hypothetical protein